jgi:hypothetical protein
MIQLPTTPSTTADLVATLRDLLARAITTRPDTVTATGEIPHIAALTIDITGATPLPTPASPQWLDLPGDTLGQTTVSSFQVLGRPFGQAPRTATIDIAARDLRAAVLDTPAGTALRLLGCTEGRLRATVIKSDVEAVALAEGSKLASAKGVDLKDVHLLWRSDSARTLSLEVHVKARKGFLPAATIRVRGQLAIDDRLNATVSNLSVEGEGMIGGLAAGMIRPRLQQAEGRSKSLLALPLDDLKIREVRLLAAPDSLTIEADFT